MAQGGDVAGTDGDHGAGPDAALADAPDERLTELLRSPTSTAYSALQELRRRHHPAVLAYARLCAASEAAARRLAAQALTTAVREAARGREPNAPLRHWLLLLTARLAAGWAADDRSAGLDPALLLVLNAGGLPEGPTPPLLPAYLTLPSRAQGLIWYGVLDAEPVERTAALLGLSRADVAHGTPPALKALAHACLTQRLAASHDPRCADFRRLIEEAVRQDGARHSPDLDAHRGYCPYCTAAFEDLTALRDTPRQALAEGLLPWSGTSYLRAGDPVPAPAPRAADRPGRLPRRRYLLASSVLALALVPVLVLLLTTSHGSGQRETAATPAPPPVTVTATVSLSPSPSPSPTPSPSRTSASPSPRRTSHRPAPPPPRRTPRPSPTPSPPGGSFAQVVNAATGRCLDIRDGDVSEGNDVVTAGCGSSATQRWRFDADLGVLRSAADPRFCLDSRGSTYRGVGIWECDAVYGDNGQNLRFTVDPDGTVRPAIDTGTAVTPDGGDGVVLRPLDGGAAQRWRAGAA